MSLCAAAPVPASLSYQEDNYKISILPPHHWTLSYFDHICQDFIFRVHECGWIQFESIEGHELGGTRSESVESGVGVDETLKMLENLAH